MSYQIGEIVRVKDKEELGQAENRLFASKASVRSGETGVIVDRLYSEANNCYVYSIKFEGECVASKARFTEDEIEYPIYIAPDIEVKVQRDGRQMVAIMYEDGKEIGRAYGGIKYDNHIGIAQATSFAMKSLYYKFKEEL